MAFPAVEAATEPAGGSQPLCNVKEFGLNLIAEHGPYELRGDAAIMQPLDELLQSFVSENRMKLAGTDYQPCYKLVT